MNSRTLSISRPAEPRTKPRMEVLALLQGHQEIEIAHRGEVYRLQLTRNGKLILTK
ncbi:hemin uptake protein HemP [Chitinimonas sp. BJB300]|uniref:hemin uptake protein HemP n=1 Tax=Chitinimonas sp. BJB300 TaxID=1559339 RepID=UPI000C0FCDFB|nr:hemin uptake protein HemP [Chitinimonas sp. BJB300]PHV12428.1 hypothetical protein CSQ89_05880 [Chitinimonas sp. BJB300]